MARDVYIANETFACEVDSAPVVVHSGITRVRKGHELLDRYPHSFDIVDDGVQFEVEEATAAPVSQPKTAAQSHKRTTS